MSHNKFPQRIQTLQRILGMGSITPDMLSEAIDEMVKRNVPSRILGLVTDHPKAQQDTQQEECPNKTFGR